MNNLKSLKTLYHKFVSSSTRKKIHKILFYYTEIINPIKKNIQSKNKIKKLKKDILSFYKDSSDENIKQICNQINKNNIVYPYDFTKEYKKMNISVYREDGFPYVIHKGVKMYGKRNMSNKAFKKYYIGLLCEQDRRSPHCYFANSNHYPVQGGAVLADIGGAEGIFSIDILEYAKFIYIFECDKGWVEALERTFAPYHNKIQIVQKYIGDVDSDKMTTLDSFFRDKQLDFLKADIEGYEEAMLKSSNETFKKIKQVLLCCYHRANSEETFRKYLRKKGFKNIEVNERQMIWIYSESVIGIPLEAPYLRHGVLYAER